MLHRKDRAPDWQEDMRSGLNIIAARTDGLARFMSAYARLAKLPPPVFQPVDVGVWIRRVVGLEPRISVKIDAGPETKIQADPDQLEQLLINLLRNAVDAALETGGGVHVGWERENGSVRVWVQDEGPGIPNAANLFRPIFYDQAGRLGDRFSAKPSNRGSSWRIAYA